MNTTNNLNEAVDDRIQKANAAWHNIRNSVITDKSVNKKLRLMLFESLITSILLYSLHIIPTNKTNISKLQRFYSKCIRVISEGTYKENCKKTSNQKIREENNISTIESKLKYYRLNLYYRLRGTYSIAYLNDKEYINNELKTLDTHINKLKII